MGYNDLRRAAQKSSLALHKTACDYSQQLWTENLPARAILALCRAIYIPQTELPKDLLPPYAAYAWMIREAQGEGIGFLGNPRISFAHQAMRARDTPENATLRVRAWVLWYLTRSVRADLPADAKEKETPPNWATLLQRLQRLGAVSEADFLNELPQLSVSNGKPSASSSS